MFTIRKINIYKDCEKLFDLISKSDEDLFPNQIKYFNVDEFQHWLINQMKGYFHELYVLEKQEKTSKIIGWALTYDYRVYDGHCSFCIYSLEEIERTLWATFIAELFRNYPLNKIFWKVTTTDKKRLELATTLGFSKEMTLKEYKYENGIYRDVCVLSVSSEEYRKRGKDGI